MDRRLSLKPKNQGLILLGSAAIAITGGIAVYAISLFGQVGRTASSEVAITFNTYCTKSHCFGEAATRSRGN
ncbi:hypothetical protein BV378_29400 [Nostoc sp. RF31YmG]|nr:hypothetical protein BV378_29400 [Nostoc sp. RF31YmG]